MGGGRAPDPGRPTPRQEAPPPGALVRPPQRAKPARNGARCGVGDGSPRPHPPHPQPVGSGPRPHPPKDGQSGVGERPTTEAQPRSAPSAGTLMPLPQRGKPARKSARCGVGDGSPHPHPPHPQPLGSGPGRTPERTSGRGWESARPRAPHTQARRTSPGGPRAAPTARKASSQDRAQWGS